MVPDTGRRIIHSWDHVRATAWACYYPLADCLSQVKGLRELLSPVGLELSSRRNIAGQRDAYFPRLFDNVVDVTEI